MTSFQEDCKVPMTKIFIVPVNESMYSAIREYFSKFGEVKSINFSERFGTGQYGFVRFFNTESATAAIAQRKHKIGGKTIKAKAADEHHQPSSDDYSSDEWCDFYSDFSDW